jgi:hypothetical protein
LIFQLVCSNIAGDVASYYSIKSFPFPPPHPTPPFFSSRHPAVLQHVVHVFSHWRFPSRCCQGVTIAPRERERERERARERFARSLSRSLSAASEGHFPRAIFFL